LRARRVRPSDVFFSTVLFIFSNRQSSSQAKRIRVAATASSALIQGIVQAFSINTFLLPSSRNNEEDVALI
jgi:hypothetical protein